MITRIYTTLMFACLLFISIPGSSQTIKIENVIPTAFFKKGGANNKLQQVAWLKVLNPALDQVSATMQISVDNQIYLDEKASLKNGENNLEILLPDLQKPANVSITIINQKTKKQLASWSNVWNPQKKWTIHCVTYSHHDLGYGDIPHRLRRENRMENMELMLKYCSMTDNWPEESKYRAVIETSEPITTYLSFCNKEKAEELKRRINEGRIQVGGIHTTINTETVGHEIMARLFYLSNRHTVDLLGVKPSISANFDDVIGVTLPFYTFAKDAGIKNLFHGYNSPKMKFQLPAQDDPVYYMKGADSDNKNKVLVRSYYYSGDAIRAHHYEKPLGEDVVQKMIDRYVAQSWPFDVLLSQDGWDFTLLTLDNAQHIKKLNEEYVYPKMICSTMDMFFSDVRNQLDRYDVKDYQKDGNNQWADQPASDAKIHGEARKMDELLPTSEKLASINNILGGGCFPWADMYQAYHRLLLYHEHTCGSSAFKPAYQYATEQQEIREMVTDAVEYNAKVKENAIVGITSKISTNTENTLVVFNPMNFETSQHAAVESDRKEISKLKDNVTGKDVLVQKIGDKYVFFAESIPSMGYKTYSIEYKKTKKEEKCLFEYKLSNDYYAVVFDSITGSISSLYDKELRRELIDSESPYKLNEYIYERYNVPGKEKMSQFYGAIAKNFKLERGSVADVVTIEQEGEGSKYIIQTITMYKGKKQIDFHMKIDKTCSGRSQLVNDAGGNTNKEALYVALPFAVPQYKFKHSLPGMTIEPITQQFDSVATASYALRHFSAVYNKDFGIAVAPIEASLIQYGHPRSDAIHGFWGSEHLFEKNPVYPQNSSMFLYLLNNMFDVNINLTQPGEKTFSYSLTSYKIGENDNAERFGWEVHNQPIVKQINQKQKGTLPTSTFSFLQTDNENIVCTTLKPAEENGDGYILRFVETSGEDSEATISLPLFDKIGKVEITDLVENNLNKSLTVNNNNAFKLSLKGFGIATVRVTVTSNKINTPAIKTEAVSDMGVKLLLSNQENEEYTVYKIYRDTKADFKPSLLTYIGETTEIEYLDVPVLNYGNWINNVLNPNTNYHYKVVAYDRWNNRSEASNAVMIKTLPQTIANDKPLKVSGLKAILVSDVSDDNYINVHWRSNCESDIVKYYVYRGLTPDFEAERGSLIGEVDVTQKGNGSVFPLKEYDHQMFPDKDVLPNTIYYYKVCAVDKAGQMGAFTSSVSAKTKYK